MWQQYRKTFFPMQALILLVCAGLYFFLHMPIAAVLVFFAVMQLGNLWGVVWSARLKRRLARDAQRLPLRPS